jgi:thioredoxin reductase
MHDVIVVGGSFAGISAALQLARARRRLLVIDAGQRRNRFASHSHGFLGQDGRDPAVIAATARAELLAYPTVTWLEGAATEATATPAGTFAVTVSGTRHEAKRIVLAGGVVDELPAIPGVEERWGRTVFHCPYCHGYELARGRIGVLATSPLSAHVAQMLPDWGATTYFTRGLFEPAEEERASLVRRGVTVDRAPVVAIEGGAHEVVVRLGNGRSETFAGLFLMPKTHIAGPLSAQLGCALENGPTGPYIQTDVLRETTVRGVFACGDAAMAAGSVGLAVGDGVRAGVSAHQSLIFR